MRVVSTPAPYLMEGVLGAPISGILHRVWSDGTVDVVAYRVTAPLGPSGQPDWSNLCWAGQTRPAMCLQAIGVVPDDPSRPADLDGNGEVDGADLGLLMGDWTSPSVAR